MNTVEPIRSKKDIEKIKNILGEKKKRDLLLFLLGINSGLRISDLLGLKVSDVRDKQKIEITEKKTGKKKSFPLIKPIRIMIKRIIKNKNTESWLFQSQKGDRAITRIQAYRILKRRANLQD